MDILKTLTHSLSALDKQVSKPTREVVRVDDTQRVPAEPVRDRRTQPDRRCRQEPFKGPERRRRNSRRRAQLLHPKTGKETSLEDRRGRNIRTSA